MSNQTPTALEQRHAREREFHRDFARRNAGKVDRPVATDVLRDSRRCWWNAYWLAYDELLALDLRGKKVLVPGCGFGDDAVLLALRGAEVFASDLSDDVLELARVRAQKASAPSIRFDVMPAETLAYADATFDAVFYNDILHHVDIPRALAEARRVPPWSSMSFIPILPCSGCATASWLPRPCIPEWCGWSTAPSVRTSPRMNASWMNGTWTASPRC
jgi:2-polyprenyl-3-methyl-5-hydroxy-6-metoxy-1,4-benzoquinol methylase